MEILEEKEVLKRDVLPADADIKRVTMQGDWFSNRFQAKDGETYFPVIYLGQRFRQKVWTNGR